MPFDLGVPEQPCLFKMTPGSGCRGKSAIMKETLNLKLYLALSFAKSSYLSLMYKVLRLHMIRLALKLFQCNAIFK